MSIGFSGGDTSLVNSVFKRASPFSVGENFVFRGVHRRKRSSIQPLLASHDSPNVQFGITQVGIPAAGGVLFHHQIRIRAQLGPRRLWRVGS